MSVGLASKPDRPKPLFQTCSLCIFFSFLNCASLCFTLSICLFFVLIFSDLPLSLISSNCVLSRSTNFGILSRNCLSKIIWNNVFPVAECGVLLYSLTTLSSNYVLDNFATILKLLATKMFSAFHRLNGRPQSRDNLLQYRHNLFRSYVPHYLQFFVSAEIINNNKNIVFAGEWS